MKPAKVRFVLCEDRAGYAASLTPQRVYEVIPDPAEANGMVRVIDDTGEDYLFEADLFRELDDLTGVATEVTVGLTWPMKAARMVRLPVGLVTVGVRAVPPTVIELHWASTTLPLVAVGEMSYASQK